MRHRQLVRGNATAVMELYGWACVTAVVQVGMASLSIGFALLGLELPGGDMVADTIKSNHVVVESLVDMSKLWNWDGAPDAMGMAWDVRSILKTLWDEGILSTAIDKAIKQYKWWKWAIMATQIFGTVGSWFASGGAAFALSVAMLVLDAYDLIDGIVTAAKECKVGGEGNLQNEHSKKCLDSWHNHVQQWACHTGKNQKWKFEENRIKNPETGKCIDLIGGSTKDGTKVQLWPCHTQDGQKWTFQQDLIKNPKSGKCLDLEGYNVQNGASIGLWPCHNDGNQKWKLRQPPNAGHSWIQTLNNQSAETNS